MKHTTGKVFILLKCRSNDGRTSCTVRDARQRLRKSAACSFSRSSSSRPRGIDWHLRWEHISPRSLIHAKPHRKGQPYHGQSKSHVTLDQPPILIRSCHGPVHTDSIRTGSYIIDSFIRSGSHGMLRGRAEGSLAEVPYAWAGMYYMVERTLCGAPRGPLPRNASLRGVLIRAPRSGPAMGSSSTSCKKAQWSRAGGGI